MQKCVDDQDLATKGRLEFQPQENFCRSIRIWSEILMNYHDHFLLKANLGQYQIRNPGDCQNFAYKSLNHQ